MRGRGLNGCATKEKKNFFIVRKKVPMVTKPEAMPGGGGANGLSGRAIKKKPFFAASLTLKLSAMPCSVSVKDFLKLRDNIALLNSGTLFL